MPLINKRALGRPIWAWKTDQWVTVLEDLLGDLSLIPGPTSDGSQLPITPAAPASIDNQMHITPPFHSTYMHIIKWWIKSLKSLRIL